MRPGLFEGTTRHRRYWPRPVRFRFPLWMVLADADTLVGSQVDLFTAIGATGRRSFGWGLVLDRRDLHDGDPSLGLGEALRDLIGSVTGVRPEGAVRTLTQARDLGYVFNPLTVHWVQNLDGDLEVVVLEVTNTPWQERHSYVIDLRTESELPTPVPGCSVTRGRVDERGRIDAEFPKALHVSPFLTMDERYRFRARLTETRIWLQLENRRDLLGESTRIFDADLTLERVGATPADLRRLRIRHLLQTRRVWSGIHVRAGLLALRRIPFQPHPDRSRVRGPISGP